MSPTVGWTVFGWQGITARLPEDWHLAALGGDRKAGYLRLDDSERPRLEIKWSDASVDIDKALDKYLQSLGRPARRGRRVEIDRTARVVSRRAMPKKRIRGFAWREKQAGRGVIWRCDICNRTVIVQVVGSEQEDLQSLAARIIPSMQDHPEEGGETWGLYGFVCRIPEGFRLEKQRLMAGFLELEFSRGKRHLRVARWGMAEVALAGKSVSEWFEHLNRGRRDMQGSVSADSRRGEAAARLTGWRRRRGEPLLRLLQIGRRRPPEFAAFAWHCAASSRLYLVEEFWGREESVLEEVVAGIPCHGEPAC